VERVVVVNVTTGAFPKFDTSVMSTFYMLKIWACAYEDMYVSQIGKFCRRVVKFGYTAKYCMYQFKVLFRKEIKNCDEA
jgi:hypothetical protein